MNLHPDVSSLLAMHVYVQTWSNLGDALVSLAEQHFDSGQADSSRAAYSQATEAYERSCTLSSSDQGDDLPSLLHNWGVGLHSMGTHSQVSVLLH